MYTLFPRYHHIGLKCPNCGLNLERLMEQDMFFCSGCKIKWRPKTSEDEMCSIQPKILRPSKRMK